GPAALARGGGGAGPAQRAAPGRRGRRGMSPPGRREDGPPPGSGRPQSTRKPSRVTWNGSRTGAAPGAPAVTKPNRAHSAASPKAIGWKGSPATDASRYSPAHHGASNGRGSPTSQGRCSGETPTARSSSPSR